MVGDLALLGVATVDLARWAFDAPLRHLIAAAAALIDQAERNGRDRIESLPLRAASAR